MQVCSYDRSGLGFSDRAYQVCIQAAKPTCIYVYVPLFVCRTLVSILMTMEKVQEKETGHFLQLLKGSQMPSLATSYEMNS